MFCSIYHRPHPHRMSDDCMGNGQGTYLAMDVRQREDITNLKRKQDSKL